MGRSDSLVTFDLPLHEEQATIDMDTVLQCLDADEIVRHLGMVEEVDDTPVPTPSPATVSKKCLLCLDNFTSGEYQECAHCAVTICVQCVTNMLEISGKDACPHCQQNFFSKD